MEQNIANEIPLVSGPRRPWLRSLLCGLAILVSGIVIGAVAAAVMLQNRPAKDSFFRERSPEKIAAHMQKEYGLDDDQKQKVQSVLADHMKRFSDMRSEMQPRIEAEHEAFRAAMEQVLTPEQAGRWRADFERMRRPWHDRPPQASSK